MNMKRMFALALTALLLCLPALAMAATTYDLKDCTEDESSEFGDLLMPDWETGFADGDTITGTAAPCRIIQTGPVPDGATITLQDVKIPAGTIVFSSEAHDDKGPSGVVQLNLQGNNHFFGNTDHNQNGLQIDGRLKLSGTGAIAANDIYILRGCDLTLPPYSSEAQDKDSFTGWEIVFPSTGETRYLKAGEALVTGDEAIEIQPYFWPFPEPELPESDASGCGDAAQELSEADLPRTGDESRIMLWAVLAALCGAALFVRRKRHAGGKAL